MIRSFLHINQTDIRNLIQDSLVGVGLLLLVLSSVLITITAAEKKSQTDAAILAADTSSKTKSEFLANMSHEIRTPMTAIIGFADILYESGDLSKAPPERIDAIKTIQRNAMHLLALINDILDISKIESGKLVIENIQCSPIEVMQDVHALMRPRAEQKNLKLTLDCVGPIPTMIHSDPTRLRQILLNLVSNAVKFTEQGSVKVVAQFLEADDDRSLLQFDVVDDGIGMTSSNKPTCSRRLCKPIIPRHANSAALAWGW